MAAEWIYPINPNIEDIDGEFPTPDYFLEIAESADPALTLGINGPGSKLRAGDRVWIYFSRSVGQVAAVADVTGPPVPGTDTRYRLWCPMVLCEAATRSLNRTPVALSELSFGGPQTPRSVPADDLELLKQRAGLP